MMKIFFVLFLGVFASFVSAEPIRIVAFGASNTFGYNVSRSAAYPAQLEVMLKAKGYDVVVVNEGTSGLTTADLLARLDSAVPMGTQIVIFQPGNNDRRSDGAPETNKNLELIVQRLIDRKVLVLFSGNQAQRAAVERFNIPTIEPALRLAPTEVQFDGIHLTANGYRTAAEKMLPAVERLIESAKVK